MLALPKQGNSWKHFDVSWKNETKSNITWDNSAIAWDIETFYRTIYTPESNGANSCVTKASHKLLHHSMQRNQEKRKNIFSGRGIND